MNQENENEVKQSLKLFIVLSRAFKALNEEINQHIQAQGLHPTEFGVLELLYHKGDQPLQKIGDKILLASGSITYVVDKLEKKGYLRRSACPNDRRVTYAQITDEGRELIDRIFPEHENRIHELMSVLSVDEKETAISLLKQIGLSIKDLSY